MRIATLTLALLAAGAPAVSAQSIRLNPYAGWYHFDESSFEKGFETSEAESDPVYGLRLGLGGTSGWSIDLAYGRTKIAAEGVRDDVLLSSDATIQLFYAALNRHVPLTGPLDLFLSGGIGGIQTDFEDQDGSTDVLVNYGAGVAIPVGAWRVRADLKDQVDLCDAPEEFEFDAFEACFEDEALHNVEVTAGVEIPL
jgi:hypothetical protein